MSESDFNVFVGSETGFLKGVNLNQTSILSKNFKKQIKNDDSYISSISWTDQNENDILIGFKNQNIALFDTSFNNFTWSHSLKIGEGPLINAYRNDMNTIVALKSGEIGILNESNEVTNMNTLKTSILNKSKKKSNLCCVKSSPVISSQIATGGCENDLAVWDISRSDSIKPIFQAKNVRRDMLDLRVPVWVSDLTYLPNSNLIATTSRHMHVRLYDPKAQRRPVINFEWEQHPLTSLAAVPFKEREIVVGTNHGRMALFDLRKVKCQTPVRAFKSFHGGIRQIAVHGSMPLVFSVSIDRYIRVHNLVLKSVVYKHYLKSRLSGLLVRRNLKTEDYLLEPDNTKRDLDPVGDTAVDIHESKKIKRKQ